ncbi:sulfite exporter TauE/SafE family protein [Chloroflexia bacterium SDU3-3]|nr:sulfite exporter TauE/SafE family protein [Chloroflexia bacterium SDU3-3]
MLLNSILLFCAAFIGGTLNSVAGGGSFFTFPSLLFAGIDAKMANATSTIALWPGSLASVLAYREEMGDMRQQVRLLAPISMIGGLAGALLLLVTPSDVFEQMLPYLMLVATLLFTFSARITAFVRGLDHRADSPRAVLVRAVVIQAVISVYGGFFGGGIGILMLAALALMGMEHIHRMNALKALLGSLINGIAVVTFIIAREVEWGPAVIMIVGAILGGYIGAAVARKIDPKVIRSFVIVVGLGISAYLFVRG